MNFKNYKGYKRKAIREKLNREGSLHSEEWFISASLILSQTYQAYESKIVQRVKYLSKIKDNDSQKQKNNLIVRMESAIYLKEEAERIKQMIKEDESKNMEVE